MAVLLCRASQPAPFAGGSTPAPFDRAMLFLLKLFLIFHLLPLYFAAPLLPSGTNDRSQQTRKSGHEVGQVFSGDQLPDGLKKAPIIQPTGSSSLISSFSGYSFNYVPSSVHDGIGKNQANVEEAGSPYDLPAVVATQPATSSPSTGSSRNDAFLLRPAPTEQFLPQIPPHKQDQLAKFLPPPNSQRPKLTGWVLGIHEPPVGLREPFPGGEAIVNPATYYMEGADLTRVRPPRCELTACEGPMPNDMDFQLVQEAPTSQGGRTCHRAFVPLNGCLDGRGYLVGMLCSICCDCSAQLAQEMQNSRGWAQGYMAFNNWPERHKR